MIMRPIRTLLCFATAPLAVTVIAFLCELAPTALVEDPFMLFYPVVLIGGCVGGMQSALLATALAAIATDRLFLTSIYSSAGHSTNQDAWLTTFVFGGAILSVVAGALRERARTLTGAHRVRTEQRRIDIRVGVG
jgi:K+-sensing histidine kinase KdpD